MPPTTNRSPDTRGNKSPNTRGGKKSPATSKKAMAKTVVKKASSARKTKVTAAKAATEKKRSAAVHLKANDVPIVRGNGVLAVAFRKTLSESSTGRKKWDTATRQAVEHFDGTWDAKTVVPYVLKKLGKTARFLCTDGDESVAASSASVASLSKGSTHVWHEMNQEQIISACHIKFNRIVARNSAEENEDRDHHDVDMMETEEQADDGKKKASPSVTPPPGAEGSAGEATAEGKKATSSTSSTTTAEPAAAPPRQAPTFFDRVRGLFGWGA